MKKHTQITKQRTKPKILPIPDKINSTFKIYRSVEANKVIIPAWRAYVADLKKEIKKGLNCIEKAEIDIKVLTKKFNGLVNVCKRSKIEIPNRILKKQKPTTVRQKLIIKAAKSKKEFFLAVKDYHEKKINVAKFSQSANSILSSSFILSKVLSDYSMDEHMLQLLIIIRAYQWFVYADGEKWNFKVTPMKRSMTKLLEYELVEFHENFNRKAYCCTNKGISLIDSITTKINGIQNKLFSDKQITPQSRIRICVKPKLSLWKSRNLPAQP